MGQKALARLGQGHACRAADEEGDSELVLEVLNATGERRLADVQPSGGARDAALLGDDDEGLDLIEAHEGTLSAPAVRVVGTYRTGMGGAACRGVDLTMAKTIVLKDEVELHGMRAAGRVAAATLAHVAARVRPGMSTAAIDALVRRDTRRRGGRPSQLGYHGFPAAVCTSVNEVVCHGIPRRNVHLRPGDIVNIDVTTRLRGLHGDTSTMVVVGGLGAASPEARHVVAVARRCLEVGIAQVRPGARLGDIGAAIQSLARREGCSVVTDYGGHGIGFDMHEAPHVPHVGEAGVGLLLQPGMTFTIEPMINLGGPETVVDADGWTVRTRDGSLSAQFEHTVAVTADGVEVLTPAPSAVADRRRRR